MSKVVKKNLEIKNLKVSIDNKEILHQVDLSLKPGKVIALMGPNGSGKSTLAQVLMGNSDYTINKGSVMWQGKNILKLKPHQRAKLGLFMSFQYPYELPGINMYEFLSTSFAAVHGAKKHSTDFEVKLYQSLKVLKLSETYLNRFVNEGFSGGEKKKSEILQMLLLNPKIAILDETDSGLDIDALKLIAKSVNDARSSTKTFLVITHYQRLLNFLKPDEVYVMLGGRIVKKGGPELVKKLEAKGYDWLK